MNLLRRPPETNGIAHGVVARKLSRKASAYIVRGADAGTVPGRARWTTKVQLLDLSTDGSAERSLPASIRNFIGRVDTELGPHAASELEGNPSSISRQGVREASGTFKKSVRVGSERVLDMPRQQADHPSDA
jgi:hypothetical protein